MKRACLVLFLTLAFLGGFAAKAEELPAEQRVQFLEKMTQLRAKYPGARAEFREEKHSRLLQKPLVSEGSLTFESPDKFRREITGANPSVTVSNGKVLWIYYPKFNEAERYALGERAIFDDTISALTAGLNFANIEEFYTVHVFREDGGYRITLSPKRSNMKRVFRELTVWFDGDLLLQKSSIIMAKGDQVETTYSHVKRTTIPNSEFEFEPPAGASVSTPLGK